MADVLRDRAQHQSDTPFVRCGDGEWLTYLDVETRSDRIAAGLARLGVSKGDRVAMISTNRPETVDVIFACAKLGAIEVALSAWLKGEFLRYQLEDSGAEVIATDDEGLASIKALGALSHVRSIVTLDSDIESVPGANVPFVDLATAGDPLPSVTCAPTDLMAILYTSGTTGSPKGCMLSHRYFMTVGSAYRERWGLTANDRIFTALPLFHAGGQLICLMTALMSGMSVAFEESFSASRYIPRAIEADATVLIGTGSMAMAIIAQPADPTEHANRIRIAHYAPVPPDKRREFEKRFDTRLINEGYGQTECAPVSVGTPGSPRDDGAAVPLPFLDVRIADMNGNEVPAGEVGEILVRAKEPGGIYSGYWTGAGASTQETGWHHTGDNGTVDSEGNLRFVDRLKDSLRRRGENVSSIELESALLQIDGMRQAAATGVPSPLGEDDIKVTLVYDGPPPEPTALFEIFAARIPYYAVPRYVEFRESLPTTVTGRVQKHLLRDEGITPTTWDFEALGLNLAKDQRRQVKPQASS